MITIANMPHTEDCMCHICQPPELVALEFTTRNYKGTWLHKAVAARQYGNHIWVVHCGVYLNGEFKHTDSRLLRLWNRHVRDAAGAPADSERSDE